MNIDLEAIKKKALEDFHAERVKKLTTLLTTQMRAVEQAKQILRAEEMKLKDLEAQINDGTVRGCPARSSRRRPSPSPKPQRLPAEWCELRW